MKLFRLRRSSSFRPCRSKNGRGESKESKGNHRPSSSAASCGVQPSSLASHHPNIDLPLNSHGDIHGSDAVSPYATTIDMYEDRIDELGQMMAEQGRCLDELTARSRRLSSENNILRERLLSSSSSTSNAVAAKQSPRGGSFSLPTSMSPLKHIIRNSSSQRSSADEAITTNKRVVQKLNDDNLLLIQQAELLANELTEANRQLAERDEGLASLGTKLSSSLEKARSCKELLTCHDITSSPCIR